MTCIIKGKKLEYLKTNFLSYNKILINIFKSIRIDFIGITVFYYADVFVPSKLVSHNRIRCIQVTGSVTQDLLLVSCRFIQHHIFPKHEFADKFVFRFLFIQTIIGRSILGYSTP